MQPVRSMVEQEYRAESRRVFATLVRLLGDFDLAEKSLPERLDSVLAVVYLFFNEGYSASSGTSLTRADLSEEAIRLGPRWASGARPANHFLYSPPQATLGRRSAATSPKASQSEWSLPT